MDNRLGDKLLGEMLLPYGFRKIAKTHCFIRLYGDGVFQGACWDWSPRGATLSVCADSMWSPDYFWFLPTVCSRVCLSESIEVNDYGFSADGELCWDRNFLSPENQLTKFKNFFLQRLVNINTQEQLYQWFKAKEAIVQSHIDEKYRNMILGHVNLALRVGDLSGAIERIDGQIQRLQENGITTENLIQHFSNLVRNKKPRQKVDFAIERIEELKQSLVEYREEIVDYQNLKEQVTNSGFIEARLQAAKKKNLEDYSILMKGKVDDEIAKYL